MLTSCSVLRSLKWKALIHVAVAKGGFLLSLWSPIRLSADKAVAIWVFASW